MNRRTRAAVAGAAVVGLVTGVAITLASTEPPADAGGAPTSTAPTPDPSTTATTAEATTSTTTEPVPASDVLLVWTSGGLPPGFGAAIANTDGVDALTVVHGDQAGLVRTARADGSEVDRTAPGWTVPLDVLAVDPSTFAGFVAPDAVAAIEGLVPGSALLTETSMALRGLDVGSSIELAGGSVMVSGTVDDRSGAGAEVLVHVDDAERLAVATPRYALLRHPPGQREPVTAAVAAGAEGRTIRFRSPAETTWLRHGDAVVPQVFVKRDYGEFAFRDRSGRDIEIDPAWVERFVVEAEVPILGRVRCHAAAVDPLRRAMRSLADQNLSHLVDRQDYAGCWSPRRIVAGQPLSRHAWGVAVDLNIDGNPRGSFSTQDPRLVEAMRSAGFTWGGLWLVPDPGHYELAPD